MKKRNVFTLLITVAVLVGLVKLGFWQLRRAELKGDLQQQYQQRQQQWLSWEQLLAGQWDDLRGYRISLSGQWQAQAAVLLDNQVFRGQVGYRWLVPVAVAPKAPWILVDLGFVAAPRYRQQLPQLPALPQISLLTGRILQPQTNPLADQLQPELVFEDAPAKRIQALNFKQLTAHFKHPFLALVLWLEQPAELGFERPWQPIPMAADKHYGYAVQWFGLAFAWLVIVSLLVRRAVLKPFGVVDHSTIKER
ncbi:MAG: SURF1 family protein [Ferrimonas sp.]